MADIRRSEIFRPHIENIILDRVLRDDIPDKLKLRLKEKGDGIFISTHEILGAITEEYTELIHAVRKNNLGGVGGELIDIAVGAAFGLASLRQFGSLNMKGGNDT